ncbi:MAG: acyl-CoA dehydrogenase family protein [Desulfatibacillaceae bacterium]
MSTSDLNSGRPAGLDPDMLDMVLDTIEKVRRTLLPPDRVLALDLSGKPCEDIVRKLTSPEIGLHLVPLPGEAGGMGGGAIDSCTVVRAVSRICLGIATSFFALQLGAHPLMVGGTPEQREKWLGRIAEGNALVACAVTEPGAGSDLSAATTRAEPAVRDGVDGYLLRGVKQFISNGSIADIYTVLANTPEGPSFFIVEKGAPGLVPGRPKKKHGIRCSDTAPVVLDNVFVPSKNLVGLTPGLGNKQAGRVFGYTRLMVAAMGIGAMDAALGIVVPYARKRVQFGAPLSEKQGYTHSLVVPHVVRRAAAEAYVEEIAARVDAGEDDLGTEGSIAKLFATEAADACATDAVQALGGYGYMHEYGVEKIRRDARILCIYEGTSEIQRNIISVHRWRSTVKTGGALYRDMAGGLSRMDESAPRSGTGLASACVLAVNSALLRAHRNRLTRQQAVMFALADAATWAEHAAALGKKASRLVDEGAPEADGTACAARLFAAETADRVAGCLRLVAFAVDDDGDEETFLKDAGHDRLLRACRGALSDMGRMAGYIFQEEP